nr:unnamed protein product [Digitaria exilis]
MASGLVGKWGDAGGGMQLLSGEQWGDDEGPGRRCSCHPSRGTTIPAVPLALRSPDGRSSSRLAATGSLARSVERGGRRAAMLSPATRLALHPALDGQ